jgi:hypothetical protein
MQEKHLFEYAVIRVVPRVEREEFLNVGVILYCRDQSFLQILFKIDDQKLLAFCGATDIEELNERMKGLEKICRGGEEAGPIGKLDTASRFRWLTAYRSTVIQTSKVHPGFCDDAAEKLQQLFTQLVL